MSPLTLVFFSGVVFGIRGLGRIRIVFVAAAARCSVFARLLCCRFAARARDGMRYFLLCTRRNRAVPRILAYVTRRLSPSLATRTSHSRVSLSHGPAFSRLSLVLALMYPPAQSHSSSPCSSSGVSSRSSHCRTRSSTPSAPRRTGCSSASPPSLPDARFARGC